MQGYVHESCLYVLACMVLQVLHDCQIVEASQLHVCGTVCYHSNILLVGMVLIAKLLKLLNYMYVVQCYHSNMCAWY